MLPKCRAKAKGPYGECADQNHITLSKLVRPASSGPASPTDVRSRSRRIGTGNWSYQGNRCAAATLRTRPGLANGPSYVACVNRRV